MSKVGQFVADANAGTHCFVTLDSGDKIFVNHSARSLEGGRLSIELWKWMGFGSEPIFSLDLETPEGGAALRRLRAAVPESAQTTPIGALVDYAKEGRNVDEVKRRYEALVAPAQAA